MKRFAMFVAIALIVVSTTAILYFRHQGRPQNVLLITLDGLRRDHVSYFGYEKETTPNIDALARQGFAFGNVIPTGCETPHSLGSLFTSIGYRYHHISDQVHHQLPSEFYTLAEAFFDQGYITSGVTANPVITKSKNFDQGFMIYEDFSDTIDDLLSFKKLARAEVVGQTCLDFLERYGAGDRQHPFFLYAHFFEPHPPWFYEYSDGELKEIEETFPLERGCFYLPKDERYRSAADSSEKENIISMYDGAVYSVDRQVGKIVDRLKEIGEFENTLIAVSSDHGYELLDRYAVSHGLNPFDEVSRLFLILFSGDKTSSDWDHARDLEQIQARIFDIGPTLAGLVGLQRHPNWQGLDLFRESEKLPAFAFTEGTGVTAIRNHRWKLVHIDFEPVKEEFTGEAYQFWVAGDYEKPASIDEYGFMLFDLAEDPQESTDVKGEYPEVYERLKREYEEYQRDLERDFALGTTNAIDEVVVERLRSLGYVE